MASGFININKPIGLTSFAVVSALRRITGIKKIGHAGTLDPLAGGVLICAIGREATRRIHEIQALDKEYAAEIEFGKVSDTYDCLGNVKVMPAVKPLNKKSVQAALKYFEGEIEQQPPIFSAKKIHGQPAYKLARQGKKVELKPATIKIYQILIKHYAWPKLVIVVRCGKGAYIRSLAHDLGQRLGAGAILTGLIRTAIGPYTVADSVALDELTSANWPEYCISKI